MSRRKVEPLSLPDVEGTLEDVPLSFDCSSHYSDHVHKKPSPRLEKIKAAIKYFFSMKKEEK